MGKSLEKVHRPWAGMGLSLHLGGTSLPPSTGCLAPLHPQAGSPDTSHFFSQLPRFDAEHLRCARHSLGAGTHT